MDPSGQKISTYSQLEQGVLSFVDDNQICVVFFINFFFALKNAFDLEIRHDYDKEA